MNRSATITRCLACGQNIEDEEASRCPLCKFPVTPDERVTGVDVTPYARTYAAGTAGWWVMCRWVWAAGAERLKHLALMRSSAASRRFALRSGLAMGLGLAMVQAARDGWHFTTGALPPGKGWIRIIASSLATSKELWWDPAQTFLGGVAGLVSGLLLLWAVQRLLLGCTWLAHQRTFRGEQRMRAAMSYGSAWGMVAVAAAVVWALRPLALAGEAGRWALAPSERTLNMIAGALLALAGVLWWVWLVRVAATAPPQTRGRVMGFFLVGVPVLAVAAAVGWWWGLEWGLQRVFAELSLAAR